MLIVPRLIDCILICGREPEIMNLRIRLVACLFATVFTAMAWGTPTIDVGSHNLLPNQAGQQIQIFVSGDDAVQGLNLFLQVADGGSSVGGSIEGPEFTAVDILAGTIFDGQNTGQVGPDPNFMPDQIVDPYTTTPSGTVAAGDGSGGQALLATATISTVGWSSGTWDLKAGGTVNGDSDFVIISATINNGTITVPEPATGGMLLFAAGLLTFWFTKRRRGA